MIPTTHFETGKPVDLICLFNHHQIHPNGVPQGPDGFKNCQNPILSYDRGCVRRLAPVLTRIRETGVSAASLWGRLAICGGLAIRLPMSRASPQGAGGWPAAGGLAIRRRLTTCPTSRLPSEIPKTCKHPAGARRSASAAALRRLQRLEFALGRTARTIALLSGPGGYLR